MCTLDIVTAQTVPSLLAIGTVRKRTIISRPSDYHFQDLDLYFISNSIYIYMCVCIWAAAAFIGFKIDCIN